jgi:hypothetical protein
VPDVQDDFRRFRLQCPDSFFCEALKVLVEYRASTTFRAAEPDGAPTDAILFHSLYRFDERSMAGVNWAREWRTPSGVRFVGRQFAIEEKSLPHSEHRLRLAGSPLARALPSVDEGSVMTPEVFDMEKRAGLTAVETSVFGRDPSSLRMKVAVRTLSKDPTALGNGIHLESPTAERRVNTEEMRSPPGHLDSLAFLDVVKGGPGKSSRDLLQKLG